MATKKLKTGQRVTVKCTYAWAVVSLSGALLWFSPSRREARDSANSLLDVRIVRLNPITGVVRK